MTPAPITSARGRRFGISVSPGRRSLHDDCPGHALAADITVKLAVVRIGAGLGETLLKLRPRCQDRRAQRPVVGDGLMAALVNDPYQQSAPTGTVICLGAKTKFVAVTAARLASDGAVAPLGVGGAAPGSAAWDPCTYQSPYTPTPSAITIHHSHSASVVRIQAL